MSSKAKGRSKSTPVEQTSMDTGESAISDFYNSSVDGGQHAMTQAINVRLFSLAHEPRLLRGLKSEPTRFICPCCGKDTTAAPDTTVYCNGREFTNGGRA